MELDASVYKGWPLKGYYYRYSKIMRMDKYLWCIRLAKTRSIASKLCDAGKVRIKGVEVKPSKEINPTDQFELRDIPIWRSYTCLTIPKSRVGPKLVSEYAEQTTSEEDLKQILRVQEMNRQNKFQGIVGRPTKKTRRNLDKFRDIE